MSKPAILFVGHDASRTGAPMALLHFMRWFKEVVGWPFSCLLKSGGELEKEFAALCPTTVLAQGAWHAGGYRRRILGRLGLGGAAASLHEHLVMSRQVRRPGLIYCNTIAALPALELAARRGRRVLCHVHELEFVFRATVGLAASRKVLDLTDRFIACSQAVADNLVQRHQVKADRIEIVHEYMPTSVNGRFAENGNRRWLREKLGLRENTVVVGGSGALGWRKATDLFVQLAAIIRRRKPELDLHFLWLGGAMDSGLGFEVMHDVEAADLIGRVTLMPLQPDPIRYFSGLDIFVLPSREDPYPLVCLESAACGIPIVCFDGAGGMPEFVEKDCGIVVPYLNTEDMASALVKLAENPELRKRYGNAARVKVGARHDVSVAGPKLFAAMQRTMES